jgi:hypothetical protein
MLRKRNFKLVTASLAKQRLMTEKGFLYFKGVLPEDVRNRPADLVR